MGHKTSYLSGSRADVLRTHKATVHEGVRPYPCDLCQYSATTSGDLTKHKRAIHQGIRYACQYCEYNGKSKQFVKKHILTKHLGCEPLIKEITVNPEN